MKADFAVVTLPIFLRNQMIATIGIMQSNMHHQGIGVN